MSKKLALNEYRYTIGEKGYLSMYSNDTEELLLRMEARVLLDYSTVALGIRSYRMVEGDELEEVEKWVRDLSVW